MPNIILNIDIKIYIKIGCVSSNLETAAGYKMEFLEKPVSILTS